MLIEVGADELIICAPRPIGNRKIMGTEALGGISQVIIEHMTSAAQRREIMRGSLSRMALFGGLVLAYMLVFRSYPLYIDVMIALASAAFIGPLNFATHGGLWRKREVVRFVFIPIGNGRPFYLEVLSAEEPGLRQALLAAGLSLEGIEPSQALTKPLYTGEF